MVCCGIRPGEGTGPIERNKLGSVPDETSREDVLSGDDSGVCESMTWLV
jgi:hypothetical protein